MVEFGKGQLASEIFEDVKAGIRQNISVGYMVNKLQRTKDEQNREYYLATSWTPLEASLVSIPADTSRFVGVGRKKEINTKVEIMSEEIKNFDEKAIRSEESAKAKAEALRSAKEILDLGKHHNQRELAEDAIASGMSIEQFRGVLLDNISNDKPLETVPADLGLNEKEKGEYSLLRAINAAATGDWRTAGYERELSDEIAKRSGKEARGFYVPTDLKWAKRDQTVGTDSQGGYLVGTDHLADQFIEALYARLTLANLGGQVMTGLKGDISIPKLTTATSNAGFVAEGSAPTEGAAVFGQVQMSPKTLACYVDVSRKLMYQSDPSVEQVLRNDIVNTFARKIDEVGIEGGGSNEPSGILANTDAATVAIGTNGGAITYSKIVDLVKEVEIDNAIIGDNPAFLTNPKVIAALRTVAKQASGVEGNFILDPNNTMLGYGVNSTTLVPSDLTKGTGTALSALIFGDFSQLMMGFWSGVDVVVDTASLSTSGGTRLAFFQDMDIAIRHGQGFSFIKDIVAS
jgi:HK97 family phage major capsid protein